MAKTHKISISHTWNYENAYRQILQFFNDHKLVYDNHSVPKDHRVHSKGNDRQLRSAIATKIKYADCVIILAGVYSVYKKWINKEIRLSKSYNKPIIVIEPWGFQRTSSIVKNNANIIVKWQGSTIVRTIKNLS